MLKPKLHIWREVLVSLGAFVVILIAVYQPLGKNYSQYPAILLDATSIQAPLYFAARRSLAHGEFPGWEPGTLCGAMPIYANLMRPIYYPLNLLSYICSFNNNFSTAAAFYAFYMPVFHQVLAFLGMYLLINLIISKKLIISFIPAVWYALSPSMLMAVLGTGDITALAWLPWIVLLVVISEKSNRLLHSIFAGLLMGTVWLGSHIQFSFYLAVGTLLGWLWAMIVYGEKSIKKRLISITRIIMLFMFAAGFASIHIIPFIIYYFHKGFPETLPPEFLQEGAATLQTFINSLFLFDYPINQKEWLYILDGQVTWGAVGFSMIVVACLYAIAKFRTRINLLVLLLVLIFSSVAMMGHNTVIWPLFRVFPGFHTFHYPQRIRILVTFFGTLLAAGGLNIALNLLNGVRRYYTAGILFLIMVSTAIIAYLRINQGASFLSFTTPVIMFISIIVFMRMKQLSKHIYYLLVILISIADLIGLGLVYHQQSLKGDMLVHNRNTPPLAGVDNHPLGPGTTPLVEFLMARQEYSRYASLSEMDEGSYYIPMIYDNVFSIGGFVGHYEHIARPYVDEYKYFRNIVTRYEIDLDLINLLNVRYLVIQDSFYIANQQLLNQHFLLVSNDPIRNTIILINPNALPRAFLVDNAKVKTQPQLSDLQRIDYKNTVLLEEEPIKQIAEYGGLNQFVPNESWVKINSITDNTAEFIVSVDNDKAYLFYSDCYHHGWKATINGYPAKIYRANLAFKAIIVPKGVHLVKMKFRPPGIWVGLTVSLVTILTVAVLALLRMSKRLEKSGRYYIHPG